MKNTAEMYTATETYIKFIGKSIRIRKADIKKWQKYDVEKYCRNVSFMGFVLPVTTETSKFYNKRDMHIIRGEKTAYSVGLKVIDEMIKGENMTVNLIFKIAAVGILVTILCQVLKHSGREEHAFLLSLAGLILVLMWIVPYIYELFETIQMLFEL